MAAVPFTVILESKKIKSVTVSIVSPSICHEVMRLDAMILVFLMLSFKPTFSLSSYILIKRLFSSSSSFHNGQCVCRTLGPVSSLASCVRSVEVQSNIGGTFLMIVE